MPRVLRIINRFNLGGPTFNAAYLTKFLEPEFETLLIGGLKDESEAGSEFILENLGIQPMVLEEMRRAPGLSKDYKTYKRIRAIIKEFKPDIVHTHASKAGAIGRLAAHHEGVKAIVHTFHGNVFKGYFGATKNVLYKNLERYLAKRTHAIIAISDLQKSELTEEHRICAAEKTRVIPLGFDLLKFKTEKEKKRKAFREKWSILDNEIVISIVGRLVPIKNHKLFIDAMRLVAEQSNIPMKAMIVGDGESRAYLEEYIKVNCPKDHPFVFTSWIREVDEVTAGSDIIALSSLNEGTPVSLIEAQASGTPIVSTDVGGIRDIVIPEKTALLSPSGDAESFAFNLLRLINQPYLRSEMSAQGWPHVEDRFHYSRLVKDMRQLYLELLKA